MTACTPQSAQDKRREAPVTWLHPALQELNAQVMDAYHRAAGLALPQMRCARRLALGMPVEADVPSAAEVRLAGALQGTLAAAEGAGIDPDTVGWCMVAAEVRVAGAPEQLGEPDRALESVLDAFLQAHAPAPARVLDVASWTGLGTRRLLAQGYEVALLDPAAAALEMGAEAAARECGSRGLAGLYCGRFDELLLLPDRCCDICLCLDALLYAGSQDRAREAFRQMVRIASRAVVVGADSRHGTILRLREEGFAATPEAVEHILRTGATPPAVPENGGVVHVCFTPSDLRTMARDAGMEVESLVGIGAAEAVLGERHGLPPEDVRRLELMVAHDEVLLSICPGLLLLCTRQQR